MENTFLGLEHQDCVNAMVLHVFSNRIQQAIQTWSLDAQAKNRLEKTADNIQSCVEKKQFDEGTFNKIYQEVHNIELTFNKPLPPHQGSSIIS